MKSLTPIAVFFMMISIISLITEKSLAIYFSLPALFILLLQLVIMKQQKNEPAIFFNVIVAIIITAFSLFIKY